MTRPRPTASSAAIVGRWRPCSEVAAERLRFQPAEVQLRPQRPSILGDELPPLVLPLGLRAVLSSAQRLHGLELVLRGVVSLSVFRTRIVSSVGYPGGAIDIWNGTPRVSTATGTWAAKFSGTRRIGPAQACLEHGSEGLTALALGAHTGWCRGSRRAAQLPDDGADVHCSCRRERTAAAQPRRDRLRRPRVMRSNGAPLPPSPIRLELASGRPGRSALLPWTISGGAHSASLRGRRGSATATGRATARASQQPPRRHDWFRRNPAAHAPSSDACSAFAGHLGRDADFPAQRGKGASGGTDHWKLDPILESSLSGNSCCCCCAQRSCVCEK